MFERNLTARGSLLVADKLVRVRGVWMAGWNASEVFMLYRAKKALLLVFIT